VLIVAPDFDRRIDLPGAGPCPRPVEIDRRTTALDRLVSLRIYSFAGGTEIDGEAESDAVFIVLMRGAAQFAIAQDGAPAGRFALDAAGGDRAVLMPPHASYHLTATADCDVAYARCVPAGEPEPVRAVAPLGDRLSARAGGMAVSLATLDPGASLAVEAAPEQFVHVRSAGGVLRLGGEVLEDWASAVLTGGERTIAGVEGNPVDILIINATAP
jgi:hypothetical protein